MVLAHDRSVESVVKVARISVAPAPGGASVPIEITFRNLSGQPVTAFEFRLRIQYAEGGEITDEGAVDFLKTGRGPASRTGTSGRRPATFLPGGVYRMAKNVRVGPDGQAPIRVEAHPVVAVLADRTAFGDSARIARIAQERGAEAEGLADAIADLRRAQAARDPGAALAARIAQLKKNGAPSSPYFKRARLLESYVSPAAGTLDPQINALLAQQKALAENAAIVAK